MTIFYSELSLIGGEVLSNVDEMIRGGAGNIELMLDGPGWNDFHLKMDDLAAELLKRPVTYSVHMPVWDANLTSENATLRQAVMELCRQTIVFAAKLHAGHVTIHPGFCNADVFPKPAARKRAEAALRELVEFNKKYGMLLLIENVGDINTSIFTFDEFVSFLDSFPKEVGYLIDTGHAHMNGWSLEGLVSATADRLAAVHLHTNDGARDSHLPIGDPRGTIHWDSVFSSIQSIHKNLNLVLEYNIGIPVQRMREGKELLEKAFR